MTSPARLAFPVFLLAVLALLFDLLLDAPWSAHAQDVPTLQVEDVSASEGAGALEFTVSLAGGATSTQTVTVAYATSDGTATAGNDYAAASSTLTIQRGDSSGVISVPITDDDEAEGDETFTLTLTNPSNAVLPGHASSVTVTGTIADNDKPTITISLRQDEVFVGQPAVFDFTRTGSATDRLLIPFRVSISDLDNVVIPGALYDNWSPSFITPSVVIPANVRVVEWSWHPEDGIGQDFVVYLSPYQGSDLFDVDVDLGESQIDESFFTLTVRQRPRHQSLEASVPDDSLPAITIAAGTGGESGVPTLTEGDNATFTLFRTGATSEQLIVRVYTEEPYHPDWTTDDTDNPSVLFYNVTFATGTATTTLTVPIEDDDVAETADWLEAQISPPAGSDYRKGDPYRASVNIIDESVDHDSLSNLVEVGIVAVTDSVDEGEQVRVDTVRPEFPDDGRDYPPLNVKVHISQDGAGIPEDRLGIIASVHPWYAFRGVNRLGFPTLANDGREPPTTVTFTILESPEYRIDPDRASVTVTIRDQDPEPVLEIADSTAHRGAGSIDFQVSYADGLPSYETVTVDYATSDGTATAGREYTAATSTLTIPPGEIGGVISVPLLLGENQDPNLDFSLALSSPSNAVFADAPPPTATGKINYKARVSIRARQTEVLEGKTALFELTRDGTPTADLTVPVFTQELNHPVATSTRQDSHDVSFSTGSSTATLEVTAYDDGEEEPDRDFLEAIIIQPWETSEYRVGSLAIAKVEIRDLLADVTIAADQDTIDEGDIPDASSKDVTFTLTRTGGNTSRELTVKVRVDDPEMIRCLDHVQWSTYCSGRHPTFEQEVTFATSSATTTLSEKIFNDWRDVPDESALTVTVIDGEGYRPGNPDSASVTLVDDDYASVLILSASHDEITEGNTLTCTATRYGDISGYEEQFNMRLSGTGRRVEASVPVRLAAREDHFTYTFDLDDNDRYDGDWTQTCRIDWIDLYVPLEQERQYFVVLGPRTITIPVRDAGGSHVTIDADQTSITEGNSATFTLTRAGDILDELTVRVSVEDPAHFMRGNHDWGSPQVPSRVDFEAGSATATLSLKTRTDWRDIPDGVLTATVEPGDYRDYRPGATSSASVTVTDNDTKPVFELSANDETRTEGENVVFKLTRTGDFTHPQTVRLLIGREGAQKVRTYEFRDDNATSTQTVIPTRDNDLDEPDTVFVAEFYEPENEYYAVSEPYSVTVTVVDDDLPRVSVEARADSYREGERPVFRLTREGQTHSLLPVKVKITEIGQSTVYNPQYQLGTRTPVMGVSYDTYDLHLFLDEGDGDEFDGAVELELLASDDYVIDPEKSTASFTVIDTDPEPVLQVSGTNATRTVSEDGGAMEFTVSYEGPASQKEVAVDYYTLSGTATAGVDYTATSSTLTFAEGVTEDVISVPVAYDSRPEHDETFFLVLTNPRNARLEDGEQSVASLVTIEDDAPRVSIDAVADEVTEGEPAVFNLIRTGDLTGELFVSLLVMEERTGSESTPLFPMTATFPAGTSTVQVSHPTVNDDVDARQFYVIAFVRDLAALARTSTYLPLKDVAFVTILDDELPTVTIEADAASVVFGADARFTLTREGDLSVPLTVNLDITQGGEDEQEEPLPDWATVATGTSTAIFEAGSSTAVVSLATRSFIESGVNEDHQSVQMAWGSVGAALPDSDAYITGDPASAAVLIFDNAFDFPIVYLEGPSQVAEGEDLVFTLHRTKGESTSLNVWVRVRVSKFYIGPLNVSPTTSSVHQVTFAPGSTTTTFTVPTEANEVNDGNRQYTVSVAFWSLGGDSLHLGELGYIWENSSEEYPASWTAWARDDDIPTVWITPEMGEHIEDPDGGGPAFTVHRDSYTSTWSYVFISIRTLVRWPPPIPDKLHTRILGQIAEYKHADNAIWLQSGESSRTDNFDPRFVGPLGGESEVFLYPNYCGEDVLADCHVYPQYHIGTPSSGLIKVYNRFAGIMVEPVEAEVEEGKAAVFRLTRFGGTPVSNDHPLTVRIEVTQDGEYFEEIPPQTVKFRGWPETAVDEAVDTIELSIPTIDDDDDERHGSITLRVLPPETIYVDEPSSYEVGVDQELAPFETATVQVTDNDYYPPPISISDARAGEADGRMDFIVTVAPSEREMSVEWNTVSETGVGMATAGTDYTAATGTLTFAVGETAKTITVNILDDGFNESDETFEVTLATSTVVNALIGDDTGIGTIEDDDEGRVVTIRRRDPTGEVVEGDTAEFIVQSLGGSSELKVNLKIDLQGDFTKDTLSSDAGVIIQAGQTQDFLRAITIDDDKVEANGSITATILPGNGYLPGKPDTATLNIRDNDRIISIGDVEAGEGQGEMTFTVTLSATSTDKVSVEVYTSPGTATSDDVITETSLGRDFEPKTERLVFEAGQTVKDFSVTLVDDDIDESKEDFSVRLSSPSSNLWLTASSTATGTIGDNDARMKALISRQTKRVDENEGSVVFAVELVHEHTLASERDTKLFWTVTGGSATEGADYAKPYSQQRGTLDIPVGHLTGTIEVDLIDDELLEERFETFTVELVDSRNLELPDNPDNNEGARKVEIKIRDDERLTAAVTARSDSIIEGSNAVFDVALSDGVTTKDTLVKYTVSGTATSGVDYIAPSGTSTIPAGSHTGTITIETSSDAEHDPDETLVVTLTSVTSSGRNARFSGRVATVTILDPGTVTVSVDSAWADEGARLYFDVTLSQSSKDDVAVQWETADDPEAESAATANVDYLKNSGAVTVPAGETSAVISVQTVEDTVAAEGDETFRLDLTAAHTGFGPLAAVLPLGVASAVGTILDDDDEPTGIGLTATPDQVSEDAGATSLTVEAALEGQNSLANDTLVQLALEDGTATSSEDYEPGTARLIIPAGTMAHTASLTLTTVDDTIFEGDETVSVTGTAADLSATPDEITITDDDTPPTGVTLTLEPDVIGEGAGETALVVSATLTGGSALTEETHVTLSVEGVSLTLVLDDGATTTIETTAADADDFDTSATTLTIPASAMSATTTLTLTPVDDTLAEGDETAQVSGTATGLDVTPTPLTIEDNDQKPTRISLSASPTEMSEGDGETTLTVTAMLQGGGSRTSATDVSLTVDGVTATAGEDFTAQTGLTLTIPSGRLSHTADLTLTPLDDNVAEGTEQLAVRGSNSEPGLPVSGVRIDLLDNDDAPTSITLSLDRDTVAENEGAQRLTVTAMLEGSSRRTVDTSVRLTLAGKTATESDYSALTRVLTIKAGESEGTATVVLVPTDDHIDEDDETLEVQGSTSGSRSGPQLEVSSAQVTIRDDDTAGVTVTPTKLAVVEGRSGSYRVRLNTQPSSDVTITVSGHSGTEISVSTTTLTFTQDNWSVAQQVTVTAAHDDDGIAEDEVPLIHTVTGVTGSGYEDVTAEAVTVTIIEDDMAGIVLSTTTLSIDEGATTTYTAKLASQPTGEVTVAIDAPTDSDLSLDKTSLTFSTSTWDTTQTVTVTAAEDEDAASDAPVTLTHTANGGDYVDVQDTVTVTIAENDTAVLSVDNAQAAEDGVNVEFTVTISAASGATTTVHYATSDGTATAGEDYTHATGTLTFDANSVTSQTISVLVTDDDVDEEEEETFTLTLSNAEGATLSSASSTATGTIIDNDDPTVTVSFGQSTYNVDEGNSVDVTVTLSADPEREVTIQLTHEPQGGATSTDYSGVPESLVFQSTETEKSFTFSAASDAIDDDGESVALGFGTLPERVTGGTTATVSIDDDDSAGVTVSETALSINEGATTTYTVVLDTEPTGDVTVIIAGHSGTDITVSGDTLTNGALTFTSTNWDTAQTVTVTAAQDDDAASDAVVTLTHTVTGAEEYSGVTADSVTVTIVEKDASVLSVDAAEAAEGVGNVVFTVTISAASGATTTVDYATSDVTATAGQDYTHATGTLTFPVNSISSQTISVSVIDDAIDEEEEETFTLTLSNVQEASLAGGGETLVAIGTITDDDDPTVTASFEQSAYSVDEGGTVEVTVTLSADPEREVTIQLTHEPQGGATSTDYSGVPESVEFQRGDTEKSFTFSAASDDIDDDGESVALAFGTLPTRVSAGTTATVSITDDDTAGVTVSETALSINEGATTTYTVKLDTEPTGDVTVTIAGHSGTDVDLSTTTLTFKSANWNAEQTVTVTAGDDDDAASDAPVTLTHTVNGTGEYAGVTAGGVTVTIVEKDASVLSVDNAAAAEGGGNVVFTVTISAASGATTTVDYATSDVTATAGQDYTHATGTLTFPVNSISSQTISVSVIDDAIDEEEEETFTLTLSNVQGASLAGGGSILAVTGTITDDDDPTVTASFEQSAYSVDEGGTVEVTVTLSADPEREVTIQLTHEPQGGATSTDYSGVPESVEFQRGDTEKSFTFSAASDDIDDDGESVALAFGTLPTRVSAGTTAAVSITDDDTAGVTVSETALSINEGATTTYTVKLDTEPTGDVTVTIAGYADTDVTLDKTSITFSTSTWNMAQTVTVTAGEDDDAASDPTVTLAHTVTGTGEYEGVTAAAVTVTIVEKDASVLSVDNAAAAEGGGNVVFTVSISAASGATTTVDYATSDVTATAGQDYTHATGTLTFSPNSVTSQTISVPVTDDTVDEEEEETFTLTLSNVQEASLAGGGETLVAIGTITDDDDPTVTASFEQSAYSVDEGGTVEVTVTLSADPEREVTIQLTHEPQGGATSTDYSGVPESVEFQRGDTEKSFTFSAASDAIDDDGESVALGFGDLPDGVSAGATVTVTITDDDIAGVTVSTTTLSIIEGDASTYTAVLDTEPTADVTVTVGGASGDVSVDKTTLTFRSDNWDTEQTVTVTAAQDADAVDEDETTLTHTVSGGGYDEVTAGSVTVTITDDDDASLSLALSLPDPTNSDADGSGDVTLNDTLTYTVTATNNGNVPLSGVTLSDLLVDRDGHDCESLDIGEQCQLTGTHTVTQADVDTGVVTNTANANANELSTPVTVSQQTPVAQERALTLTKIATTTSFTNVGDRIAYTYTVANSGTVTLSGTVAITDDKIASTEITCAAILNGGLAPSATTTCIGAYTVVQADLDAGGVTNKATASLGGVTSNEPTVTVPWAAPQNNLGPQLSIAQAVEVLEDAGTVDVTVTMSTSSLQTVMLDYATSDDTATAGTDYTSASSTLTFAPGVTEQGIQLTITNDAVDEEIEDETFTVTLSNPVNASLGDGTSTITIIDDDDPAVTVNFGQAAYSVSEGATTTIKVTLSAEPEREVTIHLTHEPQGGATSTDYSGVPESLTFGANDTEKTFTFRATSDEIDDDGESVTLAFGTLPGRVTGGATATVSIDDDDSAGVTVSETTLSIDEGESDTYTVKLDTEPTGDVTVTIAGHSGTDVDLSTTTLTFTSDNWDTAQTVTVTAGQDDDAASDASVTLTHTVTGTDEYAGVTADRVTVTIVEKDASVLSVDDAEAAEGVGNVVFTVTISAVSGATTTVDYATSDVTATAGQDYTETTGTLTFAANSVANQTISVPVIDDTVDEEEEETFTLTLSNVQGASLAGGNSTMSVTGTITDNDDPTVTASFGQSTYSVNEGNSVDVTVTLSADPEREVTIQLTHEPQGDTSSGDYSGVPDNLTFGANDTEKTFTFRAIADDIDDDGESVALGFGTLPTGVTPGTTSTVSITDDDTAGVTVSTTTLSIDEGESDTYTVKLDTEPTGDVTVTIAGHSGTDVDLSTTTLTFTSDNWDTAQTVTVTAGQDDDAASDASVTLTHTVTGTDEYAGVTADRVTVTIVEKDASVLSVDDAEAAEGVGNVVFTVTISAVSGATTTVDYATSDVTATAGQDYTETTGTLTFAANSVANQTISVPVIDDTVDEAEEETFTLTLSNAQGASLAGGGSDLSATGTITDNDAPKDPVDEPVAPQLTLLLSPSTISESGTGNVSTVTASLNSTSTATTTITVSANPASAVTLNGTTLTIAAGLTDSTGTVTITAVDNDVYEVDQEVTVSGSASNDVGVTGPDDETLTITEDDDRPVTVGFDRATYTVAEGSRVSVSVTLDEAPGRSVTVPIDTTEQNGATTADYSGVPSNVTFVASETVKSITFTAIDDSDDDDGESVELTFGTLPPDVTAGVNRSATVNIDDNDGPAGDDSPDAMPVVTLKVTPIVIEEQGGSRASTATVTASLDKTSAAETTVTISTDPSAARWFALSENMELSIPAGGSASKGMVTITALNGGDFGGYRVLTVDGTARNDLGADGPDPVTLTIMGKDEDVIPYPENGTGPVTTFTSTDPENGQPGEGIDWDVTGVDADDFFIDARGMLMFRRPPDYENPTDRDRAAVDLNEDDDMEDAGEMAVVGEDHMYQITVRATEQMTSGPDHRALSSQTHVTVMVTDVNEPGAVILNRLQPEVGTPITATLYDPDGDEDTDGAVGSGDDVVTLGWQWYVSKVQDPVAHAESHWTAATGAGSATYTYTPAGDRVTDDNSAEVDEGRYLRAVVMYLDMGREDTDASVTPRMVRKLIGVSLYPVREEVSSDLDEVENPENGSPGFSPADSYTRSVAENSPIGTPIGDPVVAVDPNDDTLTYELDDDRDIDAADTSSDVGHFSIDMATGQLEVAKALDYEGSAAGYEFYVRATDPSGETAEILVTVIANDANDAPVIMGRKAAEAAGSTPAAANELRVNETDDDDENAPTGGPDLNVFTAMDEDARGQIFWDIEGEDADDFDLTSSRLSGPDEPIALRFKNPPNHEAPTDANRDNAYKVTLIATDSHGATDVRPLTIFVDNVEEIGKATLSEEQPLIGEPMTVAVEDTDSSVAIATWQWLRATSTAAAWEVIPGATAASYSPVKDDSGYYLRAYATYIDSTSNVDDPDTYTADERTQKLDGGATLPRKATMKDGSETDSDKLYRVMVTSHHAVRVESETSATDTAPHFAMANQDRTVVENAEVGTIAGDPVQVVPELDAEGRPKTVFKYDLDATVTDADRYFTIDADSGQIRVGEVDFPSPLPAEVDPIPTDAASPDMDDPVLDYEGANTFSLIVTAKDASDSSRKATTTVTVSLEDLNERPYFDRASREAVESPIMYGERRTNAVVQLAGVEPDGHDLRWEVTGADASDFVIVDAEDINDGKDRVRLVFNSQPDYENGRGSATTTVTGDTYSVTVRATEMTAVGGGPASAAELPVTVQVTNANEPGVVDFNLLLPEVGTPLTAVVSDQDNVDTSETQTWTWYRAKVSNPNRSPGADTEELALEWQLIDGANAATYEPRGDDAATADVESPVDESWRLLARVEYTDGAGTSTAVGITAHPVRADVSDADNNSPDFNSSKTTRETPENTLVGMPVGMPVDVDLNEDEDVLTYSLVTGPDDNSDADAGDAAFFAIDKATGQIMVKKALSAEMTDGRTYTGANAAVPGEYVVFVRATDPSGEGNGENSDDIEVTITATDVNEAPSVSGMAELKVGEADSSDDDYYVGLGNTADSDDAITPNATTANLYRVSEEDTFDIVTWPQPIAGHDGALFEYSTHGSGRRLHFISPPDFENPSDADRDNVYEVTIMVTDKEGALGERSVRITVTNVDEQGTLTLSPEQPRNGMPVVATLTDPDGIVGITGWEWFATSSRSRADAIRVSSATMSEYTSTDRVGQFLWAKARYRDGASVENDPVTALDERNDNATTTRTTEQHKFQHRDENGAPDSSDDLFHNSDGAIEQGTEYAVQAAPEPDVRSDMPSGGVETFELAVYENTPSTGYVGAPLPDLGPRNEIGGPDGSTFVLAEDMDENGYSYYDSVLAPEVDIEDDKTGQLAAAMVTHFDYEADKSTYTIDVTDPDSNGDISTYRVTIRVMDVNEPPTPPTELRGPPVLNTAPHFGATSTTRVVAEDSAPGTNVGDPVVAIDVDRGDQDTLVYTLGGPDAESFAIDPATGQITTSAALDYETKSKYVVEVTATDADDASATIIVTIIVSEVGPSS